MRKNRSTNGEMLSRADRRLRGSSFVLERVLDALVERRVIVEIPDGQRRRMKTRKILRSQASERSDTGVAERGMFRREDVRGVLDASRNRVGDRREDERQSDQECPEQRERGWIGKRGRS